MTPEMALISMLLIRNDLADLGSFTRRCEVWTRPAGIEATRDVAGYYCLEAPDTLRVLGWGL